MASRALLARALFACTLLAIATATNARHLLAPTGPSCAAACGAPVFFRLLTRGPVFSYACSVASPAGEVVGYQLSTANDKCTVAGTNGDAVVATDYTCLCMENGQTQGLSLPGPSGTCADSCAVGVDGSPGVPLGQEGGGYACMAAAEVGTTNSFGSATGKTCSYAGTEGAVSSETFSCVCGFSTGAQPAQAPRAPAPQPRIQAALPTAG